MKFDDIEEFLEEIKILVRDFSILCLDEANAEDNDQSKRDEKIISILNVMKNLLTLKINMKMCQFRTETQYDRKNKPQATKRPGADYIETRG